MHRFIATEFCAGTLEDYFCGKYKGPRFINDIEILHQVTQGLAHLHSKNVVHRDIKPTNILIFVTQSQKRPKVKLADFGISRILKTGREDFTNTSVTNPKGTRGWMGPEVYECDRFDFSVDIWALGLIFAYTLSKGNKHPFGDESNERIFRIKRKEPMLMVQEDLKVPYSRDGVAFRLIQSMLEMDPSKRPTATDILRHSALD